MVESSLVEDVAAGSGWPLGELTSLFRIYRIPLYNDEPKIAQYMAERSVLDKGLVQGYGSDVVRSRALRKAICEAVEREALLPPFSSTSQGPPSPGSIVDASAFSSLDRLPEPGDPISMAASFEWTQGVDVINGRPAWVPSQVVFCPFEIGDEPLLRLPSSSGAACGASLAEAKCRGLLEVFERDSFMCWYLSLVPAEALDMEDAFWGTRPISSIYDRYNLELHVVLLETRWPFPVVFAAIVDNTGIGPGLTVGMKCHPDLAVAVSGAIFEAQQLRPWLRDAIVADGHIDYFDASSISDYWKRALYWSRPGQHKNIESLWRGIPRRRFRERYDNEEVRHEDLDWDSIWSLAASSVERAGFDLFFVDLSANSSAGRLGLHVVKVLVPQAHPLYMDERFPYNRSKSLEIYGYDDRWSSGVPPHPFA